MDFVDLKLKVRKDMFVSKLTECLSNSGVPSTPQINLAIVYALNNAL